MTLGKWSGLFGILAAVLLVGGVIISGDTPEGDSPDEEWIAYIEEDEKVVLIRAYIFVAASLALVAFPFSERSAHLGRKVSATKSRE